MEEKSHTGGKPLTDLVTDALIQYIKKNRLKPGDRLPNEYELADILGVGRSTVREGVRALVSRNVLEIRRGAGTFVSEKQGVADDPLGLMFYEDQFQMATDLLQIRELIEPSIASYAARHATPEQIRRILELCQRVEDKIRQGEDHLPDDILFHTAIARSSGNQVVGTLIPIINRAVDVFCNLTGRILREETISTHREVAQAIAQRDAQGAYDGMYLHLLYNRRALKAAKPQHKDMVEINKKIQ